MCKFRTHTCLCWLKFPIPCRFLYPTHLRHVPEGGVSKVSFHTRGSPLRLSQKHRTVTVSELDSSPNFQICLVGKPLWASMASSPSKLTLCSFFISGTRDFYFLSSNLGLHLKCTFLPHISITRSRRKRCFIVISFHYS